MKSTIFYVHGKGGKPSESDFYAKLFPRMNVVGAEYNGNKPWEVSPELIEQFIRATKDSDKVVLIAVSIGAFLSMNALFNQKIDKALFVSPVTDMERLIQNMMTWSGVTEKQLESLGEIDTDFGETLSWQYLSYVREKTIVWNVPTHVVYGSADNLVALDTVENFVKNHKATLSVMDGGEHWFHTEQQLAFLAEQAKQFIK